MSAIQKYSEVIKGLEFCDDFGEEPLLLAHITTDRSIIAVVGLLGGFIAMAGLGFPGLALVGFAVGNDLRYAANVAEEEGDKTTETDTPIATTEQNGAIDVTAETVGEPIAAAAPSMQSTPTLNPVTILAASITHRGLWGGQRTGKSLLASVASKVMAENHAVEVWYINLYAADRAETLAMYGHAQRVLIADMAGDCDDPDSVIDDLLAMVAAFKKKSGVLLIVDELPTMASTHGEFSEALQPSLKALCGHITDLGQSAMKRKKAVWSIGTGIVAGSLTAEGKSVLKGSSPVLVSISEGRSVMWKGQAVPSEPHLISQLKANFPNQDFTVPTMDCDRVVQIDGQWMPMPKLEVPSFTPASTSPPETTRLSQGQVNWERIKVGSPAYPEATDAIEVESWESSEAIEVDAVEDEQSHPLKEKFDRLRMLMVYKDSISVKDIQRKLKLETSLEAQQLAQMLCMNQKSDFRFRSQNNSNSTVSYFLEKVT